MDSMDVRQEIEQARAGNLITQIGPIEFRDILVMLTDESLDFDAMCQSDHKKDRRLAKKLLLVGNLISESPDLLGKLLNEKWKALYFRSKGHGIIQTELLQSRLDPHSRLARAMGKYRKY
jgi:hypothetical protein